MPLAGPRPNPNPPIPRDNTDPYTSYDASPPYYEHPSSLSSTSQHSYPHQSLSESGTTVLEPLSDTPREQGMTGAQSVMKEYRRSNGRGDYGGDEQDVGLLSPRPYSGARFDNPYEQEHEEPYGDRMTTGSSSLGPWDSASQRSLPHHSAFPLPQSAQRGDDQQGVGKKPSYGGLSYIDEDGEYYHTDKARPASTYLDSSRHHEMGGFVRADEVDEPYQNVKFTNYEESPHPYPPTQDSYTSATYMTPPNHLYTMLLFPTGLDRLLGLFGVNTGAYPVAQAIERKRRGLGGQRWPVAAWSLAVVMTGLMIYELVANYQAMGSPIATKPTFNPMIGPSSEVLINIGARFPPCMKLVDALPPSFQLACLNDTSSTPTTACSIETICGHGGFPNGVPNQSWRFVYPIFLHVGIIHLLLNMVAQVTAAAQVEREMGTVPFLLVYMAGGIYGFVLGGNFSRTGIPSAGASGALFATNACVLVDLVLHWKYEERPKLKAFLLALEFIIGFGIGYIPNAVDGLAHLGGWAMGILMGIILYPSISETKRHRYIVWGFRVIALPLIILAFVLTIKNFYTDDPNAACEWCKYLSCIPTSSNNHCSGTGITVTNTSTTKRSWELL
ncbi:hypothetical protein CI109_105566 [Kwoniella shandongensis]|uniref:Rhomboid-type serine protease n=1 Tax=Kwoniella shandongensis TaxID=1734106 RepID=A0A5M6C857_9TREE|nr:uncharacterized protein CI109_002282 [Kwoniella shandongensis]KAA5529389.1 hypothetical protein CI109_002282 [Kwoniella shandongensis]